MMKKNILATCCFAFLTLQSWASADIPVPVDQNIDGPPNTAPIDTFLPIALIMAVVIATYYINRRTKTLLNNK